MEKLLENYKWLIIRNEIYKREIETWTELYEEYRAEKILIYVDDLKSYIKKNENLIHLTLKVIDEIEDVRVKDILELRYIKNMTYDDIACKLNYSVNTIYRLHKVGMNNIGGETYVNR